MENRIQKSEYKNIDKFEIKKEKMNYINLNEFNTTFYNY